MLVKIKKKKEKKKKKLTLHRSAIAPATIVAAVAANAN